MQRENNSSLSSAASPRVRHRKRSNEAIPEPSRANGGKLLVDDPMVVVIQIFMAKELFNLLRKAHEDRHLPGFRLLNWHFFVTAMLFVYGRLLSQPLVNTITSDKFLYQFVCSLIKYHMAICYFSYIAGFIWFILTLKKKMYKYQFGQYAWTHMILIVVFTQSSFTDLSTGWLQCDPGPLFKPEYYTLPGWISQWFTWKEISVLPVQWHALCLGLFASIIAPFGGFFASGFKRAFKIKDFGDSIPGHGGITDRMDCQMVMAVFAYIYLQSFVAREGITVEMILDQILTNFSFEEQQSLLIKLGQILQGRVAYS
ncbi:hypothetical protein Goarm_022837 [Gossypium armourianum]|uniref:Phosphatidate cytidylyltransferase n=1 Tax=Gossypium armourianum TaxID=34283 RepID=A0A7J9KIA4_9ROSI|nr:hypothetical protein [Gossypium armourianum]